MNYLEGYYNNIEEKIKNDIQGPIHDFEKQHLIPFLSGNSSTGLLLGHVQSGKTSHVLGIISVAADLDIRLFIVLTSCNNRLQQQTYLRLQDSLFNFNVCDETHDQQFKYGQFRRPTVVVLKKEKNTLNRWYRVISEFEQSSEQPLIIIDDESDNASLNTEVNNDDISRINACITDFIEFAPYYLYLQVTATPYANIMQDSGYMKPEFIHSFSPGPGYLGGDYFYDPRNGCIVTIQSNELEILRETNIIPEGLRNAILNFILVCVEFKKMGKSTCNCLIHPSLLTADHEIVYIKTKRFLQSVKNELEIKSETLLTQLYDTFSSSGLGSSFEDCLLDLNEIIEIVEGNLYIINSNADTTEENYSQGFNIVIGGNSLSRGVTFPNLQITYYCRQSRVPQMDTIWQHSRLFGYDRVPELCKVYLPDDLQQLFWEFTQANNALFEYVKTHESVDIQIMHPAGSRATRTNVIKQDLYQLYSGGANYFISHPEADNTDSLDLLLDKYPDNKTPLELNNDNVIKMLKLISTENTDDKTRLSAFISWLEELDTKGKGSCLVYTRRNRDIMKNYRALLSEKEQSITARHPDSTTLFLFRLNCEPNGDGDPASNWDGNPRWVPIINFPVGICFSSTM
jgi:hypothetical protein